MKRAVERAQNISRMCFVCGVENGPGLKAHFYEVEGGELVGVFQPRPEHQGYPGRLHGGIASALLDEAMGRAINLLHPDTWGVTVELAVRYSKPVPLDQPIKAVARITNEVRRIFEGTGEILLADGSVAVEATGRYLRLPLADIADPAFTEREWLRDEEPHPPAIDL